MALKRANVDFTMAALKALVDIEFAKITADVWCPTRTMPSRWRSGTATLG